MFLLILYKEYLREREFNMKYWIENKIIKYKFIYYLENGVFWYSNLFIVYKDIKDKGMYGKRIIEIII